jgi:hypothetical protein
MYMAWLKGDTLQKRQAVWKEPGGYGGYVKDIAQDVFAHCVGICLASISLDS